MHSNVLTEISIENYDLKGVKHETLKMKIEILQGFGVNPGIFFKNAGIVGL